MDVFAVEYEVVSAGSAVTRQRPLGSKADLSQRPLWVESGHYKIA
jgi:hypothetical protein